MERHRTWAGECEHCSGSFVAGGGGPASASLVAFLLKFLLRTRMQPEEACVFIVGLAFLRDVFSIANSVVGIHCPVQRVTHCPTDAEKASSVFCGVLVVLVFA